MSRKTLIFLLLVIITSLIVYLIYPTDKARITKLFKRGGEAVEQKDLEGVLSCLSFTYKDDHGLTYLYLKEGFKKFFQRATKIEVAFEDIRITVNEKKAVAEVDVWVIVTYGANTGYLIGDAGDSAHLIFHLEKERLKWQISRTEGIPSYYF